MSETLQVLLAVLTPEDKERIRLAALARAGAPMKVQEIATLLQHGKSTVKAAISARRLKPVANFGDPRFVLQTLVEKSGA